MNLAELVAEALVTGEKISLVEALNRLKRGERVETWQVEGCDTAEHKQWLLENDVHD